MGARDLLQELSAAGVSVVASGNSLVVRPASRVTDNMRSALRTAKPELLALLAKPPVRPRPTNEPCSQPAWSEREIETFSARVLLFVRRGLSPTTADDMAERMTWRDRDGDDRRTCIECRHLSRDARCTLARAGKLIGIDRALEPIPTLLQRCDGFNASTGAER